MTTEEIHKTRIDVQRSLREVMQKLEQPDDTGLCMYVYGAIGRDLLLILVNDRTQGDKEVLGSIYSILDKLEEKIKMYEKFQQEKETVH